MVTSCIFGVISVKHLKTKNTLYFLGITVALVFTGCQKVDKKAERKAVGIVFQQMVDSWVDGDAEALVSHNSDPLYLIFGGEVRRMTNAERLEVMKQRFLALDVISLDIIEGPIIDVADDGRMAWLMAHARLNVITPDENGQGVESVYEQSILTVYEKRQGKWKSVVSAGSRR